MFLDENGVPFTGGTYFPPDDVQGRPSFKKVLENVSKVYAENREKIIDQVNQMKMVFKELNNKNSVLNQDLEPLAEKIIQYMDGEHGGFQGAPKFPQFYIFDTLFYFYKKNRKKIFFDPVKKLLKNISSRGIYDQLAGGISRYTVDEKWIVPHFEKMLYDNVLFVKLLNNYVNDTEDSYFKNKLQQTISYINTSFKNTIGLVGSAYDADSEGVEGKYYIWKYDELKNILKNDFDLFKKKYKITIEGNFENYNILVENQDFILNDEEIKKIKEIEKKLVSIREQRIKPFFDDKTQTDLNSYWIYNILHSSLILEDENLFNTSINYFERLSLNLKNNIYHCYNKNRHEIDVFLEDYVYYSLLLISIYEIKNDTNTLTRCVDILNETWELFYNNENQLLQKNIKKTNDLFVNPIDVIDNNIPNGNGIFLLVCSKLYNITGDEYWKNKIDLLTKSFHSYLNNSYSQMFSYIKILDICNNNITFTFYGNSEKLVSIKTELLKKYFEISTFIHKNNADDAFIVICKNKVCSQKLKSLDEVNSYLNEKSI